MDKKVLVVGILLIVAVWLLWCSREPEPPSIPTGLTREEAQQKVAFKILEPSYIPVGFEFLSAQTDEDSVMLIYEDELGRRITITQWEQESYDHHPYPGEEEVLIGGRIGYFSVPGPYNLLWNCNAIVISLSADLQGGREVVKNEMITIAESIDCSEGSSSCINVAH